MTPGFPNQRQAVKRLTSALNARGGDVVSTECVVKVALTDNALFDNALFDNALSDNALTENAMSGKGWGGSA